MFIPYLKKLVKSKNKYKYFNDTNFKLTLTRAIAIDSINESNSNNPSQVEEPPI